MPAPGFEWFVAWRHLRDPEHRSHRTLVLGVILLGLGLAGLAVFHFKGVPRTVSGFLPPSPTLFMANIKLFGSIATIVGAIVTFLGILFASFTVFTAISIFGVFLGTGAP